MIFPSSLNSLIMIGTKTSYVGVSNTNHSPPQVSIPFQFIENASKYLKFTLFSIPGVPRI